MSREATAWSVKGVDQATRDIARRAAQAAGMTIGEWIDNAIKADSANRGIPVPVDRSGREATAVRARAEGIGTGTAEAIFERIEDGERLFEARLRPIGYALKDVAERLVAMEKRAEQLPPPTPELEAEPQPQPTQPPVIRQPIQLRPVPPQQPQLPPRPAPADQGAVEPPHPLESDLPEGFDDDAVDDDDTASIADPPSPHTVADDPVWMDPPAPEPRKPIELRPVGTRPTLTEVKTPPPRPPQPDHPPVGWEPEDDLDSAALAREAGPPPGARQEPAVFGGAVVQDIDDDEEIAPPPSPRSRPDPVAPTYDFPAEPIDTRALGLSGERIEPAAMPRHRVASAGRAMAAALFVIAIVGSAVWIGGRQGVLPLGPVEPHLAAAEDAVSRAAGRAIGWVRQTVFADHGPNMTPAEGPADKPEDNQPTVAAVAEPEAKPAPDSTPPASPPTDRAASAQAAPEAPFADPHHAAPTKSAPPIPQPSIVVDPRPVKAPPVPAAPPAAPTIVARVDPKGSPAATPAPGVAEPLRRAEAGDPAAQFEVAAGMMRAIPPQPEEAAIWFREAAINGLAVAQFNLGVMYDTGLGTPKDDTRALLWYHSAAEQGHPLAQYNLGRLYTEGRGIPQSDTEARRWFQRAADRGVAAALHALAIYEPEEIEREGMMRRAAQAGDPEAQSWLRARSTGEAGDVTLGPAATLVLDSPTGAPDIAAIQQGLANAGYYDGPIDGIAGPVTRAAIGKFQSDNGLPATGLPSRSLRQRLN